MGVERKERSGEASEPKRAAKSGSGIGYTTFGIQNFVLKQITRIAKHQTNKEEKCFSLFVLLCFSKQRQLEVIPYPETVGCQPHPKHF